MAINRRIQSALLGVALLLGTSAHAGEQVEVRVYSNGLPSANVLADMLFPRSRKTRSIVTAFGAQPVSPQAVSAPIQFDLDSAEIRPESRADLDKIGEMLNLDRLTGHGLRIEGHTDTTGPDDYNSSLSTRRALAVANYLVQEHGVDPDRLALEGHGESRPLPGYSGRDPANRRVEFHPVD